MKTEKYETIIQKLEEKICKLKLEESDKIIRAEKALGYCKLAFTDLKILIQGEGFNNEADEIRFFKQIKPQVLSKLIYYAEILQLETHRPNANRKFQIKYLKKEFKKYQGYLNEHYEFFQYYKTNQTCFDKAYFTRYGEVVYVGLKNYGYLTDPEFCTSHDELVAHILACEQLEKYIDEEITALKSKGMFWQRSHSEKKQLNLKWTATKVALIELIYALHSSNSINNGKTDIKELIGLFEQVFDIQLDKAYRAFIDIQMRKKERTKFLDTLRQVLLNRMDQED
jgi:hypothetical protein